MNLAQCIIPRERSERGIPAELIYTGQWPMINLLIGDSSPSARNDTDLVILSERRERRISLITFSLDALARFFGRWRCQLPQNDRTVMSLYCARVFIKSLLRSRNYVLLSQFLANYKTYNLEVDNA